MLLRRDDLISAIRITRLYEKNDECYKGSRTAHIL